MRLQLRPPAPVSTQAPEVHLRFPEHSRASLAPHARPQGTCSDREALRGPLHPSRPRGWEPAGRCAPGLQGTLGRVFLGAEAQGSGVLARRNDFLPDFCSASVDRKAPRGLRCRLSWSLTSRSLRGPPAPTGQPVPPGCPLPAPTPHGPPGGVSRCRVRPYGQGLPGCLLGAGAVAGPHPFLPTSPIPAWGAASFVSVRAALIQNIFLCFINSETFFSAF